MCTQKPEFGRGACAGPFQPRTLVESCQCARPVCETHIRAQVQYHESRRSLLFAMQAKSVGSLDYDPFGFLQSQNQHHEARA